MKIDINDLTRWGSDSDNKVKLDELKAKKVKPEEIVKVTDGDKLIFSGKWSDFLKKAGQMMKADTMDYAAAADPSDSADVQAEKLIKSMNLLVDQYKQAKDEVTKKNIMEEAKNYMGKLESFNNIGIKDLSPQISTFRAALDMPEGEGAGGGSSMNIRAMGMTGGNGGGSSSGSNSSSSSAKTKGFSAPAGWTSSSGIKASSVDTFSADTDFSSASASYLSALNVEGDIADAWESITKSQNRGKELMMLFYYFARMAESGDMGAMYQFMKFITYIISKDKAKQQIEMGKKLIELQDLSRKWTDKLLNVKTDSSDPNSSAELMKTMTIVKSETDSIATSQKLISQMMEEFATVVESLTSVTKGAVQSWQRILQTVSRMS